ncbi:MAG: hypothetical protein ABI480_11560 [Chitinophagaceae bacterium]
MKIMNIEGLSADEIQQEVDNGSRFVYYYYTISFIVVTLKRTSGVYLTRPDKNSTARFLYTLLSFLFGWWGIPFGPKHTIAAITTNLRGGKDVTDEIMATVAGYDLFEKAQQQRRSHKIN